MPSRRLFQILVLAPILTAHAAQALCIIRSTVLPSDGATNVPRNVVLRIATQEIPTSIELHKVVAGSQELGPIVLVDSATTSTSIELRPRSRLEANTSYIVVPFASRFTTGDYIDEQPPNAATVDSSRRFVSGIVDRRQGEAISLTLSGLSDDATPISDLWIEAFTDVNHQGYSMLPSAGFLPSSTTLSSGNCDANFPVGSASDLEVKVRVIDWSGNISTASGGRVVKSCGCSAFESGAALLLALFMRKRPR
jgi:hypothetical protein